MVNIDQVAARACLLVTILIALMIRLDGGDVPLRSEEQSAVDEYYRIVTLVSSQAAADSRARHWKPAPDGLALEVSGMAFVDEQRLAVAIRKGEVWFLSNVLNDPPTELHYHRFASGLHEPLGLLLHEGSLLTVQRSEMTRLLDTNGDDVCDQYLTVAGGWGLTGNYHEYAFGPKTDSAGNLWLTLNLGLGLRPEQQRTLLANSPPGGRQALWRGWGMRVTVGGQLEAVCGGMRSPSGLGANMEGDMFYTDQQGNWVATNSIHHLRSGVFLHHPDALASAAQSGSTLSAASADFPQDVPYPQALRRLPMMKPPAVWLPYRKVGQSATDIVVDASQGRFGPFAGQLFVGEFTQSAINRVCLEKVGGEYQGACFEFHSGFDSAVLRLVQAADGSLLVGLSNRGWSSLGTASYGLQRLVWSGVTPFEIHTIQARHDGFELQFTTPCDRQTAEDPRSYRLASHTYQYHAQYGSDEIERRSLLLSRVTVSEDGRRVRLVADPLRQFFVHEITAHGVRDRRGQPLVHDTGWYTLNQIPAVAD